VNTIITAADVLEGDKIKATFTNGTRTASYEGVANHFDTSHCGKPRWRTADGYALFTDLADVIELLDRPKPKIEIPTNTFAQVTYSRNGAERFAVLTPQGGWKAYNRMGDWQDTKSPEAMTRLANESDQVTDFKVVFEGVAK
jgi:hypothetical protein